MIERHSWLLFVVIGSVGLVASVGIAVDPTVGLGMLSGVGPPPPADFARDPFAAFLFRWVSTVLIGSNLLTVLIAATAFRRGERWAGFAFLYWPAMFFSHLLMYRFGPMSFVQVMWLSLTVPALVVHFRRSSGAARPLSMARAAG